VIRIILKSKKDSVSCPKATQDLKLNTKNRNASIKAQHIQYGPLNLSDEEYWERAAKHWNTTPEVAKDSKCGNCTAFDISPRMLDCMPGPTSEPIEDEEGKLGYCWMHHFKCHSARTCYTWAAGGPISKYDVSYEWQEKNKESMSEAWSNKERSKRKNKCDNPRGFTMKQFCKNQNTRSKKGEKKNESLSRGDIERIVREEFNASIEEKRGRKRQKKKAAKKKDDRCTRIAKRKYDAWPSAYASGAVVQCRRGKIWKGLKEDMTDEQLAENTEWEQLEEAFGARSAAMDSMFIGQSDDSVDRSYVSSEDKQEIKDMVFKAIEEEGHDWLLGEESFTDAIDEIGYKVETKEQFLSGIKDYLNGEEFSGRYYMDGFGDEVFGDLTEKKKKKDFSLEKSRGLKGWFDRQGGKGKKGGWVDCNTCRTDKKTGKKKCKSCGRSKGEKRSKYPRCRPTPSQCKGYKRRGSNLQKEGVIEEIEYNYIPAHDATYDDGNAIDFLLEFWDDVVVEAEYRGRKVTLNKPTRGDVKKFKVYVKDPKTGNVKKVNFGDPNMRIKKSNPKRRKSFRARHNCDNPGPKTKARYWSCRKW